MNFFQHHWNHGRKKIYLSVASCSCVRIINYVSSFLSYNYALKSALLLHANTQSPDVTECNLSSL